MEFLQRCIFPRCTFSTPDAVYCAMFVHTLHSLGTPYFNTVNHIDVLICKTLQPMICCCTEYEAGRLGGFLCETLKIAYHWKSDESVYERECGNKPGFAVYYRFPNSQRVTYGQFIKVHWKWNQRITKLLIQCLESTEYMEIRNALIMLTKISTVFPVTRKSGINLEKRVVKIKSDEREDLKVLATGVAAALAARKSSWLSDDEFGMGYIDIKGASSLPSKSTANNAIILQNSPNLNSTQIDSNGGRVSVGGSQHVDPGTSVKELRSKPADGRSERTEIPMLPKSDPGNAKPKGGLVNGSDIQPALPPGVMQSGSLRSLDNSKQVDDYASRMIDDELPKTAFKAPADLESRALVKRSTGSLAKLPKPELGKEDSKTGNTTSRTSNISTADRDPLSHPSEGRNAMAGNVSSDFTTNGNTVLVSVKGSATRTSLESHNNEVKLEVGAARSLKDDGGEDLPRSSSSRPIHSPRHENTVSKNSDKQQKRSSSVEDSDRLNKRRKAETDARDLEADARIPDKERSLDPRYDRLNTADVERLGTDEQSNSKADRPSDRLKDKGNERHDREYKERVDRPDKSRGDDHLAEKPRDRSIERYGRERSVERVLERGADRSFDRLTDRSKDERNKDERGKLRYGETDKLHPDERFRVQSLPPPPPLPPNVVPHSVSTGRRDDDGDKRFGVARHKLSPRHDEKERKRSEETALVPQDDPKRRREDDFRDRKRDERESLSAKAEERDKDRDKANILKEDLDSSAASKRRKLRRDHMPSTEPGEFLPTPQPPLSVGVSQSYDVRERERKGAVVQRASYLEEQGLRVHGKEVPGKMARRDTDPVYDREWDDEKRQPRIEPPKRRHRK